MVEECIFCKIAKGEVDSKKIYENKNFFSIPDAAPQIKGHGIVISKEHFENILGVPNDISPDLLNCVKETALKLMEQEHATGFNIIVNTGKVAGQIVSHLHIHILPRKEGDDYFISLKKR